MIKHTYLLTKLISIILLSSTIAFSTSAEDTFEDIRFIAGASLGYSNFSFPEKLDHSISFSSANIMIGAIKDKWQLSVNGSFALNDANVSEEEDIGKASRRDLDITLAYQAMPNWSVFAGYKSGKTTMDFTSRDSEDEGVPITVAEFYQQKGPYIGTGYTFKFEKAGNLNFSVAYAMLDGINQFGANTDEDEEEEEELEFDDLTGRVKGDITGISVGVSWTMPLSSNVLFQTKFKINSYKQDIQIDGHTFENITDKTTSLHVGLAYVY
ncbi:MAG: hypothetical protein COB54_04545 [Alphaproteobacteria bacterium]|nr:MAG: hypothetical protein COB54_04545 [Alphaproteobacteria bacterium]